MNGRNYSSLLVFGGTFDPPHIAHLVLPLRAAEVLGLEAVAYVPAANPPHKHGQPRSSAAHRLAMLRLALAEAPNAVILTDELDRAAKRPAQPSYTVDTLTVLRERLGPGVRMRLLIGADQLRIFPTWRQWRRVVELAEPVVMLRPPQTRAGLWGSLPGELRRAEWESRLVDLPQMEISATEIRRRVARGLGIGGLVHPQVADYVRRWGLYRGNRR